MSLRFAALGMRLHAHAAIADVLAAGDTELVAIADTDTGVQAAAAQRYDVPAYADWRGLLEVESIALAIVMPPHAEKAVVTAACLSAGIHVLVDKTMAISDVGLARIEAALNASQAELSMYLTERFGPAFSTLKPIIERGELGRIAGITALRPHELRPNERQLDAWVTDPSQQGGVLVDLAVHDIDLARWYTGREVAGVWALQHKAGFAELPGNWPDIGMALFSLDDGTPVMVEADWHTPHGTPWDCRYLVTGTEGSAEIKSLGFNELTIWRPNQPQQRIAVPSARLDGPGRDLVRRIRGQGPNILTASDALAATRAVVAARLAAETGQPVRLHPIRRRL